jgi:hypothetical protein
MEEERRRKEQEGDTCFEDTRRVLGRIKLEEEMEFLLRRIIMKRVMTVLVPVWVLAVGAYASGSGHATHRNPGATNVIVDNDLHSSQSQQVSVVGGGDADATSISHGGDASSDSSSSSQASIATSSVSNYETRTPPLDVFPAYLPYWSHGGWGTVKGYFPNGPSADDAVYEQTFDPENADDMKMLKGVLTTLSYEGPLETIGGILNGVGAIFGGPDNYHHGRGFEISNALVRQRRPQGKPLLVFIDSNVDTRLLRQAGYVYVGGISMEGKVDRNWDQVYDAAVAEALPWDVDVLLISGGMKGVTVGSNIAFPGAAGAYSQANYSISLLGSVSSGITEGKGKAVINAVGYRFWPDLANRRRIPESFYNSIRAQVVSQSRPVPRQQPAPQRRTIPERQLAPSRESVPTRAPVPAQPVRQSVDDLIGTEPRRPAVVMAEPAARRGYYGVQVSQQLLELAGF